MGRVHLLAMFLVLPLAFAISPSSTTVTAVVGPDGVASVREEYVFFFSDANEMNSFLSVAEQTGNSYQIWIAKFPGVDFHFGKTYEDLSNIKLYWVKLSANAVKLTVQYSVRVAFPVSESATSKTFILNRFHLPRQAGSFVIPEGTSIVVVLPQNAQILSYAPAVDAAHRAPNMISWEGPITTNDIYIRYSVPKPAGAPSIAALVSGTSASFYISAVLIATALLILARRERIKKWIKGYVEENSEFEK